MEERDPLLSEAYRDAGHPVPPSALDAAILDAACRAVAPARRRRWFAWAAPMATTAVLVLGVSLLFKVQREAPETLRDALPAPASQRESAPVAPEPGVAAAARDGAAGPRAMRNDAPAFDAASAPAAKPRATPAPPPLASGAAAKAAAPLLESAPQADSAGVGAPPAAEPAPRPFPAETAPTPPSPEASMAESRRRAPAAPPAAGQSADQAALRESAAPAAAFGFSARQGVSKLKSEVPPAPGPEQWVERIRGLLREGRHEEARASLEELRKRWPDFVLPADMETLADPGRVR